MLLVLGSTVTLILYLLLRPWSAWKRLTAALAVLAAGTAAVTLLLPTGITRGGSRWDSTPIKESILFLAMLLGMFLRVIWDAVDRYREQKDQRRKVRRPHFDKWDFVLPALTALLVFQPVLSMGGGQPMSLQLVLFSLQNGFFWNGLFEKVRQGREQPARA